MKFKKKAAILGIIVLFALLLALPPTRDELDWCWTEWRDQAADYMQYYTDWPKGLHTAEARHLYADRTWSDTKRAMIAEANKKYSSAKPDPEARKERRVRQERFFWKEASDENTIETYQDYLQRYPAGEFAAQARSRIDELTRQAASPERQHERNRPLVVLALVAECKMAFHSFANCIFMGWQARATFSQPTQNQGAGISPMMASI